MMATTQTTHIGANSVRASIALDADARSFSGSTITLPQPDPAAGSRHP